MSDWQKRISINSDICQGQPIIRGTRIPVQQIVERVTAGDTVDELLKKYPALERDDVLAALAFATDAMPF